MKLTFRDYHSTMVLKEYSEQNKTIKLFLSEYFRKNKSIGSKDRKEIADNIYNILRYKILLDHFLKKGISWEKRLNFFKTNNIKDLQKKVRNPSIRVSFPKKLFQLLVKNYSEEKAEKICNVLNEKAPITIRANLLKISREDLFKKLLKNYKVKLCEKSDVGITFDQNINIFVLEEFQEGLFEVQDEGSQLISKMVEIFPNQKVLDYCAGSGGKTLGFAHKMENTGVIYIHDIREKALIESKKRFKRAGIQNYQFLTKKNKKNLLNKMDFILLDVPCSGTGSYRRNPDMKWKFSIELLEELLKTQREIFKTALEYLKDDGKIL